MPAESEVEKKSFRRVFNKSILDLFRLMSEYNNVSEARIDSL